MNKKQLLAQKLNGVDARRIKAVIGFDGFVDEIVHVVDKRTGIDDFIRQVSMEDYGKRIYKSAGLSTNIEMVTVQQKLGGNGPIFANALIGYGVDLTYIGALGLQGIHPVFKEMASRCRAIALAEPAKTDAVEFHDGKIISSKLGSLKDINWRTIQEKIGLDALIEIIDQSDLIGFENWTMVYYMGEIWEHIINEVLPRLTKREMPPVLFIDLADPEKREKKDILRALSMIDRFSEHFTVEFGLNKKEACEIAEIMGMQVPNYETQELEPLARWIFSKLSVSTVVIHPVKEACAITDKEFYCIEGPYCKKPKLTTGAGDNFNAGFIFGATLGLDMEESLLLGTATSGFYVRNGRSPELPEITDFIMKWAADGLDNE